MKLKKLSVVIGAVSIFFLTGLASAQPAPAQGPPSAPGMGCGKNFAAMDKNQDGTVTLEEFKAFPHRRENPEEMFKARDINGNGSLTVDEFCSTGMGRGGKGPGAGQ